MMISLAGPFDDGLSTTRRRILIASLLAALPLGLSAGRTAWRSAASLNASSDPLACP